VRGRFPWNGFGPLVILHGNLNTEGYKGIMILYLLSTVEDSSVMTIVCIGMTLLHATKQGL
jgi:hypothetical protein